MNGTLYSRNCGIELQINATTSHIEVYENKAVNYTFMVTALTFIQVPFLPALTNLKQFQLPVLQAVMLLFLTG